ncbi:RNA-binding protein [Hyphobacterium sp.]|uniref:RNA-binding protein n=1 Tax=Hyphobacterium sp. TaxID=2004662 RepID=UPI003BABC9F6
MRERRGLISRDTRPETELIRFVIDPQGGIVPDLASKLPGRGAWVEADRQSVETAVGKGHLSRALKGGKALAGLADQVDAGLAQRALSLLGLLRRSGQLAVGMDAARLAIKANRPAWRLEASDGAADGRSKLDRLTFAKWGSVPVCGCFAAEELGAALGRDHVVHAVLAESPQARSFGYVMNRLAGFRELDPGAQAEKSG